MAALEVLRRELLCALFPSLVVLKEKQYVPLANTKEEGTSNLFIRKRKSIISLILLNYLIVSFFALMK